MAAPPSTAPIPPIAGLLVRVLTFLCLLISMVVLATTKIKTSELYSSENDLGYTSYFYVYYTEKFHIFYAYRYLISCIVIGMAYSIVQTAFTVIHVTSGKRVAPFMEQIDFYTDLFVSSLLVSGAAASFGLTVDLKQRNDVFELEDKFYEKIYASTSLCLIAFVFSAIATIISHLNATRKSTAT